MWKQIKEKQIAIWDEEKWTDSKDAGKVKPVRLSEGLDMELRERGRYKYDSGFLTWTNEVRWPKIKTESKERLEIWVWLGIRYVQCLWIIVGEEKLSFYSSRVCDWSNKQNVLRLINRGKGNLISYIQEPQRLEAPKAAK